MKTTRYDARRISLALCGRLGLKVIVDPQATDVIFSHPADVYVDAECSNGHLAIKGSGAMLDISGSPTVQQDITSNGGTVVAPMNGDVHVQNIWANRGTVMAPMHGEVFIGGQPVSASGTTSERTTRRYASNLYEVRMTREDGRREVVLTYNLEQDPQLTLVVPPDGDNSVLLEVDGRYNPECLWIY